MKMLVCSVTLVLGLALPRLVGAQAPLLGADAPGDLVVRNVVYGHQAGMALTFDVFKPARPIGAGVIVVVSGGYGSGWVDPEEEGVHYGPMLETGFVVFAVRHGMSPRHRAPDILDQVTLATRYIRLRSAEWGVDPDRLGITGGSSGGHLALAVALGGDDGDPTSEHPVLRTPSRVAAVVAFSPPSDIREFWGRDPHPAFDFPEEKVERVSPILHVTPDDPPTLLIHGTEDRRVPIEQSRRLADALAEQGVPNTLFAIEGAGHGFSEDDMARGVEARVRWFSEHLLRR